MREEEEQREEHAKEEEAEKREQDVRVEAGGDHELAAQPRKLTIVDFLTNRTTRIDGVLHPAWFNAEQVAELRGIWSLRAGDVFIVSFFPIRGLQRLLVALVEGKDDPWQEGLLNKPYYCDAAASKRGARAYVEDVDSWTGRRCFKTHALPSQFPCRYPFESHDGAGVPPKILVLVSEPRNALVLWWQFLSLSTAFTDLTGLPSQHDLFRPDSSLEAIIQLFSQSQLQVFGGYCGHNAAWAQEAALRPESVKLVSADQLGSFDPRAVSSELEKVAEFLETSKESTAALVAGLFRRPLGAEQALSKDSLVPVEAINGGHLIESYGKNLHTFEEALNCAPMGLQLLWRRCLQELASRPDTLLGEFARTSLKGIMSVPPLPLTMPMKGLAVHNSGTCRVCVFALRGTCRNTEAMCPYCHLPDHAKPKRASRAKRAQRKDRFRTPSPD